jgi:hypothetical protein
MKQKKWEFIYNEHVGDLSIVDENGGTILNNKFLPQSSPDGRIPYVVRDWYLMAAAPEMLEALEEANKETMLYDGHEGRYAQIIAKAKGGKP